EHIGIVALVLSGEVVLRVTRGRDPKPRIALRKSSCRGHERQETEEDEHHLGTSSVARGRPVFVSVKPAQESRRILVGGMGRVKRRNPFTASFQQRRTSFTSVVAMTNCDI